MKVGDKVLVSPDITHFEDWVSATITKVENNSFVGIVITVITDKQDIFFATKDLFRPI